MPTALNIRKEMPNTKILIFETQRLVMQRAEAISTYAGFGLYNKEIVQCTRKKELCNVLLSDTP